jgi:hypothetical protein
MSLSYRVIDAVGLNVFKQRIIKINILSPMLCALH